MSKLRRALHATLQDARGTQPTRLPHRSQGRGHAQEHNRDVRTQRGPLIPILSPMTSVNSCARKAHSTGTSSYEPCLSRLFQGVKP